MYINELPDIVLARIFDWTCNGNKLTSGYYNLQGWPTKIRPLGVCRMWRERAYPYVHTISFIQCVGLRQQTYANSDTEQFYTSDAGSDDLSYNSDASIGSAESWNSFTCDSGIREAVTIKSNLDMFDGHQKYKPKNLYIIIKTRSMVETCIRRVMETIHRLRTVLSVVKRVKLVFGLSNVEFGPSDVRPNICGMEYLGKELSQLVSSVRHLELRGCNYNTAALTFARALVREYAHKLTGVAYPQIALSKVNCFSDKLKYVKVTREGGLAHYMPPICAENLTVLSLKFMKDDFDWDSFSSRNDTGSLQFANLKWLRLNPKRDEGMSAYNNIAWEYPVHRFSYSVIAPNLEHLVIRLCPATLRFLAAIQVPIAIKFVGIELGETHMHFNNFRLDLAMRLFERYIEHSMAEDKTINMCVFMSDILSIPELAEQTNAIVHVKHFLLDAEKTGWSYLTDVKICCLVHISDLRSLLSGLPKLERACISSLTIEQHDGVLFEIHNDKAVVEPILYNLKIFSFALSSSHLRTDTHILLIYLAKVFPNCRIDENSQRI